MKFMTPRQYWQLLFKVFFKGRSFIKESEGWSWKKRASPSIQSNIYTLLWVGILIFCIEVTTQLIGLQYNFERAVIGVAVGVAVGVALGVAVGVAWGVAWGVAMGVAMGVAVGVAWGVAFGVTGGVAGGVAGVVAGGVTVGVAGGVIVGVAFGVAGGFVGGVAFGVSGGFVGGGVAEGVAWGVAYLISYFTLWSRWFYYPIFIIAFFKKINPQKLPSYWDENICAPVPLFKNLLVNISRYDRASAINEALFLIRERPPQRKASQKALVEIAVEEMTRFREVRNIANLNKELDFLPSQKEAFPEFYNKGYEQISQLAQDARIALDEWNVSNRFGLLEKLADTIREFQKKMDFAKKDVGIPFGRIAAHWLEIVQKEIKQIEADTGRPLPHPFVVGRPIDEKSELFVGRQDIVEQIQRESLREGGAGAILFVGSRRTGKTSTLLNLKRYLSTGLKPVYVDCQSPLTSGSVKHFSTSVAKGIYEALESENSLSHSCATLADLTELMQEIQEKLQHNNTYLLLCFDEYERLTENIVKGEFRGLPDAFRYWVQHLPRTVCLFSGSHYLDEIEQIDWTDYLINVRRVPISFLDFDSALKLVTKPVPHFDLKFTQEKGAENFLLRMGRQPFLIQAAMSELVNYLNSKGKKNADQSDIDRAVEKMFESWNTYFDHIWKTESNESERKLLQLLARDEQISDSDDRVMRPLMRKEVVRKENNGGYVFCVPVFKEWIVKYT